MAALPLDEGEVFADRYRIVRCIASGGMGAVYEAVHTVTERRCAVKVMLGHTVEREELRRRFMQESKLAAQIGSEYIVDVLDAGVDEKTQVPFLIMELLEGEDLGERILRNGPLSIEEVVSYLWHAALALDRTHGNNIVHRDLKASNLFLTRREDGSPLVKVLDFGVAKVMPLESSTEGRTQTVGTPIYMAPEQFRGDGRVSPATDIYALGMLAYTLLVGVHYWKEEHDRCANPFAFASLAVHGPSEPPTIRAARQGVHLPEEFDEWFAIATSQKPQDRFPRATEAVIELAYALGGPALVPQRAEIPTPPDASHVTLRPRAGSALPASPESSSARLGVPHPSRPGSVHTGPSAGSARNDAPLEEEGAPEARTEISLSVTSGVLEPERMLKRARWRRRGLFAASVLALVAIGVGLGREIWFSDGKQARATQSAEPAPAEPAASASVLPAPAGLPAEPAAPAPPDEAPPEGADEAPPVEITPIDELPPLEEAEQKGEPRKASAPTRRARRRPAASRPARANDTSTERKPSGPPAATGSLPASPAASGPTEEHAVDSRVKLYGRD